MAIVADLSGNGMQSAEATAALIPLIEGSKVVASTTVPERLTLTPTFVSSVEFIAQKAQGSANAGNIWVGVVGTDGTPKRLMATGDKMTISANKGEKIDLSAIWIDVATNGDGVTYLAKR
jgi:hypothetical protein